MSWHKQAACRDLPSVWWFPEPHTTMLEIAAARNTCKTCEVKAQCLEYALAANEQYGLWGGMDFDERRRERRKRMKEARRKAVA